MLTKMARNIAQTLIHFETEIERKELERHTNVADICTNWPRKQTENDR